MTDLATSAPDVSTAAAPARTGSSGSAWVKWLARRDNGFVSHLPLDPRRLGGRSPA